MKTPRWDALKVEWNRGGTGATYYLIEKALTALLGDMADAEAGIKKAKIKNKARARKGRD